MPDGWGVSRAGGPAEWQRGVRATSHQEGSCAMCVCLGIARPSLPEPTSTPPRPPLRCGLAQQLSPEHLLGAWLHARRRGWESKVSWALPDPSPTEPFLSLPSRGSFFPRRIPPQSTSAPTSCPGLPFPQPSLIPNLRALWVGWARSL